MIRTLACAATALAFSCFLSADLDAQARKTKKTSGPTWVDGVSYTTDWKTAIKAVQQSGKMLFIYNGWKGSGI